MIEDAKKKIQQSPECLWLSNVMSVCTYSIYPSMNYRTTHLPICISISLSLFIHHISFSVSIIYLSINLKKTSFLPYSKWQQNVNDCFLEVKFYTVVQLKLISETCIDISKCGKSMKKKITLILLHSPEKRHQEITQP